MTLRQPDYHVNVVLVHEALALTCHSPTSTKNYVAYYLPDTDS